MPGDSYTTMGTPMIRTGEQYRDSIRDGRQVWINGERVKDVTAHPMFRPLVDVRARIYDMQHDPRFAEGLSYPRRGRRGLRGHPQAPAHAPRLPRQTQGTHGSPSPHH